MTNLVLYLYRIQSVSNLKKKIQTLNTNIILNLNESYKEAAVQEAKYKGEGTADYYKQQQIVIPAPQYINTRVLSVCPKLVSLVTPPTSSTEKVKLSL
jgi:hypothetical protein